MSKELVIGSNRHETKVATLEDDQLVEVYFQRSNEYSLAGSVHKGRVTRVLPGMQSAFVDLGLERDAFLYVTDFLELEDQEESDEIERAAVAGGNTPPREVRHTPERDRERGGRERQDRGRERRPAQEPAPAAEPIEQVPPAVTEVAPPQVAPPQEEEGDGAR